MRTKTSGFNISSGYVLKRRLCFTVTELALSTQLGVSVGVGRTFKMRAQDEKFVFSLRVVPVVRI